MSKVEDFLTAEQEQQIIAAIRDAEKKTSGEIRIHLEPHTTVDVVKRATEVFHQLKMDLTAERNGVLIYVAVEDRLFAIIGDQGIDQVVPDTFWEHTKDAILEQFKLGNFCQGIINGVISAGDQLQKFFPWDHTDINELPDEISKG